MGCGGRGGGGGAESISRPISRALPIWLNSKMESFSASFRLAKYALVQDGRCFDRVSCRRQQHSKFV